MTAQLPINPVLIDRLYEAAVVGDRLPVIMQQIADEAGAIGAMFMNRDLSCVQAIASPRIEQAVQDYLSEGWAEKSDHAAPLFQEMHPGFRTEAHYHSPDAIARMPVHIKFHDPRGLVAGAGTVIQGAANSLLLFTLEGFPCHDAAARAVPFLDALRPQLARVLTLASLRRQQSQIVVDSLALVGVGAAIVGKERRLRAANEPFIGRMKNLIVEGRQGVRFVDRFVEVQFDAAFLRHRSEGETIQSIAVWALEDAHPFALHILPIKGAAREVCESDGVLLIIADGANASVPNADLLRLLFDLTPAEARFTRLLLEGHTVVEAAGINRIAQSTARSHLRSVFTKTGTARQSELVRLLIGTGSPT